MLAGEGGHLDVVKELLKAQADVNAQDKVCSLQRLFRVYDALVETYWKTSRPSGEACEDSEYCNTVMVMISSHCLMTIFQRLTIVPEFEHQNVPVLPSLQISTLSQAVCISCCKMSWWMQSEWVGRGSCVSAHHVECLVAKTSCCHTHAV